MPLRLSVCFRNLKCKKGHSNAMYMLFLTAALNCESICPVFKASVWLLPALAENYSCATARDLHTVPF